MKDSVPQRLRSRVVYKFTCAGCSACYIVETTPHICTRVREYVVSDKASHVYKHLQSSGTGRDSCSAESFHDSRFFFISLLLLLLLVLQNVTLLTVQYGS